MQLAVSAPLLTLSISIASLGAQTSLTCTTCIEFIRDAAILSARVIWSQGSAHIALRCTWIILGILRAVA